MLIWTCACYLHQVKTTILESKKESTPVWFEFQVAVNHKQQNKDASSLFQFVPGINNKDGNAHRKVSMLVREILHV
jgi:hypothetical protein